MQHWLQAHTDDSADLMAAMRYSALNGGKRVRAMLVYGAAQAVAGQPTATDNTLDAVACALECLHAYSLIHDDLPAMDDDDLRRGKPSCHIAFNEAVAILAGDALQTQAFAILSSSALDLSAECQLRLVQELAQAAGAAGMVLGQAIDLAAVAHQLSQAELETMHRLKTGALIAASVRMGALAAGASDAQLAALEVYAACVGLAFQVQDDVLDVTADTATLGKPQGADAALDKPTFVTLMGLDEAKRYAELLHQQALAAISEFDQRADSLRSLSDYVIRRRF